jgi:Family of unknown function (DUF6719)
MPTPQRLVAMILAAGLASAFAGTATAAILKQEPPLGKLKYGQRVLVDDGTCPRGQIKEVIGGDHVKVGGKRRIERRRRCIPR